MPNQRPSFEDQVAIYLVKAEKRLSAGAVAEFGPPPDSGEVSDRDQVERFAWRDPKVDETAVWAAFAQQVQQVEQAGLEGAEKKAALKPAEDMLIDAIHPFRREIVMRGAATPSERVKLAERLHRAAQKQAEQQAEQAVSVGPPPPALLTAPALPAAPSLPMLPAPAQPMGELPAALQTGPPMTGQGGY